MCAAGFSAGDEIKSHYLLKIQVEQVIKLVAFNLPPRSEKVFSAQQAHTHRHGVTCTHSHTHFNFTFNLGYQDMNLY